jgi:hypothetical protein
VDILFLYHKQNYDKLRRQLGRHPPLNPSTYPWL